MVLVLVELTGLGFIHETALVLYVYLPSSWNGEDSCLTVSSAATPDTYPANVANPQYYINSYST